MTWMTMLTSDACESTLVMRTLQSWKSSSFILSLIACEKMESQTKRARVVNSPEDSYPLADADVNLVRLIS